LSELQDKREAEIAEVKEWISMIGACTELIQFQNISARADRIRAKLESLLPPLTVTDE